MPRGRRGDRQFGEAGVTRQAREAEQARDSHPGSARRSVTICARGRSAAGAAPAATHRAAPEPTSESPGPSESSSSSSSAEGHPGS